MRSSYKYALWLIIIQNIMQCWVITNVIEGRRILKTKISAERGTNQPHGAQRSYLRPWLSLQLIVHCLASLLADVLWGSFVTHSFLPNEPQRTSAGRLLFSRARHELASRSAKELCASLVVVTVDSPLFTKIEHEFDWSNRYAIVLQTR